MQKPASIELGPYQLLERIGEGGSGQVYRARGPSGPVAIKLLGPASAMDDAARARFQREIAALCQRWNVVAITDEIYEHLVYAGEHVRIATLPGMWERTITISGLSKTYSVTGWRLGYLIAPERLSVPIRRVHGLPRATGGDAR